MENLSSEDLQEMALKERILSNNYTFKTAFKATLGFYAAQFVATVLGVGAISTVVFVLYKLVN